MSVREEAVALYASGLTAGEVAKRLGVPKSTVYGWAQRANVYRAPMPKEAAVAAYVRGDAVAAIESEFSIHAGSLYRWLEEAGVPKRGNAKGRRVSAREVEGVELFRGGMTARQIAAKFNVDVTSVYLWLRRAGVKADGNAKRNCEAEAVAMYASGVSAAEVAEQFGIHWGTLYGWLEAAGVPKHGKQKPRPTRDDSRERGAVAAYAAGESAASIATRLGVTPSSGPRRPTSKTKVDGQAVADMYASGRSIQHVAESFGIANGTVLHHVRQAGAYRPLARGELHPLRVIEPERRCRECGIVKATTEFEITKRDKLNRTCLSCSGDAQLKAQLRATLPRECSVCRDMFPPSSFYPSNQHQCKRCVAAKGKAYRQALDPAVQRVRWLAWQRANKPKLKATADRRRARKLNAPVVDFTNVQWAELLSEHNHCCAYCGASGVRLEREHVVPLTRGGSHTKSNIVPACRSCNASKNSRTPEEWRAGLMVDVATLQPAPTTVPLRLRPNSGEGSWNAKLTTADVLEIRRLSESGLSHTLIAERFGISRSHSADIASGRRWQHLKKTG